MKTKTKPRKKVRKPKLKQLSIFLSIEDHGQDLISWISHRRTVENRSARTIMARMLRDAMLADQADQKAKAEAALATYHQSKPTKS